MASSEVRPEAKEAALRGDAATLRECFNKGLSPLDRGIYMNVLQCGDVETVQVVLDAGGHINYDFELVGSPLVSALRHNHYPLLEFLFSHGADPNLGSWGHWLPPLSVAVRYTKDIKGMRVLLEKGAKIKGTGALHVAAILGCLDRMQLLLEHGADVNEIPFMSIHAFVDYCRGGTPVHWAIAGRHPRAVKLLLDHHPDLSVRDNEGISVRDRLAVLEKRNNL